MAGTWQRLAYTELSSGASTIDSGTFTAKENLKIIVYTVGGNSCKQGIQFNSITTSTYAYRYSSNGGSDNASTSQSRGLIQGNTTTDNAYSETIILNESDKEKLYISHSNNCASGAGNAPSRYEIVGKWTESSDSITSIQIISVTGNNFGTGSYITVWGASADIVTDEKTTLADATVTTDATANVTDDLTTDKGWSSNSSDWAYNTSDYLYFNPIRRNTTSQDMYIDLQDSDYLGSGNNLHASKWVVRLGKFETVSLAGGNADFYFGVSDGTGDDSSTQQSVYFALNGNSSDAQISGAATTGNMNGSGRTYGSFSPTITNSASNELWLEIIRDSDNYTLNYYSDEYSTLASTATIAKSGISNLRYIKFTNDSEATSSYTWVSKLHGAIKIYNGITAVSTTSSSAPPANTRYEETDTRKIYRRTEAGEWLKVGTKWTPATTITYTGNTNTDNHGISYDIGSSASNTWVLRFEHTVTSTIGTTNGDVNVFCGLSDKDMNTTHQQNQDWIGVRLMLSAKSGSDYGLIRPNSSNDASPQSGSASNNYGYMGSGTENTKFYIEIIRTSSSAYTISISNGNDYNGDVLSARGGSTSATALRYIKFGDQANTSTQPWDGKIENVQFWDNTVSAGGGTEVAIAKAEWKERNTA